MLKIPEETIRAIQEQFHKVIRARAGDLIAEHNVPLPELAPLLESSKPKGWFAVPGMYGGFSYWLEGEGTSTKLISESWCRVAEGSGQRHEVTANGSRLVAEGFV